MPRENTGRLANAKDLSRADKLHIKYLAGFGRPGRSVPEHPRPEIAKVFNVTPKTVRKVLRTKGPYFNEYSLELIGLARTREGGPRSKRTVLRKAKPLTYNDFDYLSHWQKQCADIGKIFKLTQAQIEEIQDLHYNKGMPLANIGLRFARSKTQLSYAMYMARKKAGAREFGYIKPERRARYGLKD